MREIFPVPDSGLPLRVVLDTNVVMALWHFSDPKLAILAAHLVTPACVLLSRADCLDELRHVLAYSQFGISAGQQQILWADYAARVVCLPDADAAQQEAAANLPRCGDRDDQKFVTLAWDGAADVLVTRDKLLLKLARRPVLRERMSILSPERLQDALLQCPIGGGCSSLQRSRRKPC